ncbi:MAG: type II toxin-antitoxin system HicB family antitoxin, partial [bacterium]
TTILNYRVVVEPDERTGSNKPCFVAYCPTLGVADDGDTIDEALGNIREAIEVYVESLIEDGEEVPVDKTNSVMTLMQIPLTPIQSNRMVGYA